MCGSRNPHRSRAVGDSEAQLSRRPESREEWLKLPASIGGSNAHTCGNRRPSVDVRRYPNRDASSDHQCLRELAQELPAQVPSHHTATQNGLTLSVQTRPFIVSDRGEILISSLRERYDAVGSRPQPVSESCSRLGRRRPGQHCHPGHQRSIARPTHRSLASGFRGHRARPCEERPTLAGERRST
jgi:hypothetical protein